MSRARPPIAPRWPAERQRGMALITSMLLLAVLTIMALSMFRSYGLQERIAGNTRDKQRAINAAISAQQYAEYWLSSGNAPNSAQCNGFVNSNIGQVCTNPQIDFTVLPWSAGITYTPFTSNPINNVLNTLSTTGGQGTYYAAPVYYVTDLGPNAGLPAGEIYQIDAVGYGGGASTVAVVESTYLISSGTAYNPDK